MTPTGLEDCANSPARTGFADEGAAESGAFDADLQFLINAWEHLDEPTKREICELASSPSPRH